MQGSNLRFQILDVEVPVVTFLDELVDFVPSLISGLFQPFRLEHLFGKLLTEVQVLFLLTLESFLQLFVG